MAAPTPFFVLGPNTVLSLLGLVRKTDHTVSAPAQDWREIKVDVVIPAHNEEATIILCLESLFRQTLKPRRIVLMDDGSKDRTRVLALRYAAERGFAVESMRVEASVGKTPGVKRNARELDGDVIFILDGDTLLISPDYIERAVKELYEGVGIASACGGVVPLRRRDRRDWAALAPIRDFYERHPDISIFKQHGRFSWFLHGITNIYRDFLYFYLRGFIYRGQMAFFGSIINPIGCAVAYRREYIRELFDHYEPSLGDDLTTSEDIFIGFALLQRGYRNVLVEGIHVLTEEPFAHRLPRQLHLWSSSFLQSCYYFPDLLLSPFKVFKRAALRRREKHSGAAERRQVKEAYRQPFGIDYTKKYGRPIGWTILFGLIEKISFSLILLGLIVFRRWEMLEFTVVAELGLLLALTVVLSLQQRRLDYIWKMILSTPVRYFVAMYDLVVTVSFVVDVWVLKDFNWRK